MTTLELQKTPQAADSVDRRLRILPSTRVQPPTTPVPDHVPATMAAEHPDAAAVVGRRRRRTTIRVVGRGHQPGSAVPAFALLACAATAAMAVDPSPTALPSAPTSRLEAEAPTDAAREARSCATALLAPVGPGCSPQCSPLVEPSVDCALSAALASSGATTAADAQRR